MPRRTADVRRRRGSSSPHCSSPSSPSRAAHRWPPEPGCPSTHRPDRQPRPKARPAAGRPPPTPTVPCVRTARCAPTRQAGHRAPAIRAMPATHARPSAAPAPPLPRAPTVPDRQRHPSRQPDRSRGPPQSIPAPRSTFRRPDPAPCHRSRPGSRSRTPPPFPRPSRLPWPPSVSAQRSPACAGLRGPPFTGPGTTHRSRPPTQPCHSRRPSALRGDPGAARPAAPRRNHA